MAREATKRIGLFTHYVVLLSLLLAGMGIALLVISAGLEGSLALIVSNLGAALMSAGVVSLAWDLLADRWATEERKEEMSIVYDVLEQRLQQTQENFLRTHYELEQGSQAFGLRNILLHRMPSQQVRTALARADTFEMCCVIDGDWRDRYFGELVAFLARGGLLTAYVPDPREEVTRGRLASLFGRDVTREVDDLAGALQEAVASSEAPDGQVRIHRTRVAPAYTCYRWTAENGDPEATFGMMRLYGNRIERGNVLPALLFVPGGRVWDFVTHDLQALPTIDEERQS